MSRLLKTGNIQITQTYANHKGWSKGVDVVKYKSQIEDIIAHSAGEVVKVIDYMTGTNKQLDREGVGYGNYVMILHNNKYKNKYVVTNYVHLGRVATGIKEGVKLSQGQVIGTMGNTGNSQGAHLHFEIRLYDELPEASSINDTSKFKWIDPTPYLDTDLPKDQVTPEQLERVQIGAFGVFENAVRRAKEVINKGHDAVIKKYNNMYRVQVGAYSNHNYAVNMLNKMQALGYKDAYITTESGVDVAFK